MHGCDQGFAYGHAADCIVEYVRMGESKVLECFDNFCPRVVGSCREEYCRVSTEQDLKKSLARSAKRNLPGMIGIIDCSKWILRNCPTAVHSKYEGK